MLIGQVRLAGYLLGETGYFGVYNTIISVQINLFKVVLKSLKLFQHYFKQINLSTDDVVIYTEISGFPNKYPASLNCPISIRTIIYHDNQEWTSNTLFELMYRYNYSQFNIP